MTEARRGKIVERAGLHAFHVERKDRMMFIVLDLEHQSFMKGEKVESRWQLLLFHVSHSMWDLNSGVYNFSDLVRPI